MEPGRQGCPDHGRVKGMRGLCSGRDDNGAAFSFQTALRRRGQPVLDSETLKAKGRSTCPNPITGQPHCHSSGH